MNRAQARVGQRQSAKQTCHGHVFAGRFVPAVIERDPQ